MKKSEEIKKMSENGRKEKLQELKLELIKSRISGSGGGNSKIKNIKKTIARILTIENNNKKNKK